MKNHGSIKVGLGNDNVFYIVENDYKEYYLVKDVEKFSAATPAQQFKQKIHRMIDRTLFLTRGIVEVYAYSEEEKNTYSILKEVFHRDIDEKLKSLVTLCEGADESDLEKFKYVTEVTEYKELGEIGSSLKHGLGFPGKGLALVVCKKTHPYDETIVYLQKVDSYMEGYCVKHYEILPEMITAIKEGYISESHFNL